MKFASTSDNLRMVITFVKRLTKIDKRKGENIIYLANLLKIVNASAIIM